MKKSKGLHQEKLKRLHQFLFELYEKYTNLFAIELCIVPRLHRENILNIAITMTEYLLQKPVLLYNLIILRVLSKNIKKDEEFAERKS